MQLEVEFQAKPEESLGDKTASSVGAADRTEAPVSYATIGTVEVWMVQQVESLHPELHLQLVHNWEGAEEAGVEVEISGPAKRVESCGAKAHSDILLEGACIEVRFRMCTVDGHLRLD